MTLPWNNEEKKREVHCIEVRRVDEIAEKTNEANDKGREYEDEIQKQKEALKSVLELLAQQSPQYVKDRPPAMVPPISQARPEPIRVERENPPSRPMPLWQVVLFYVTFILGLLIFVPLFVMTGISPNLTDSEREQRRLEDCPECLEEKRSIERCEGASQCTDANYSWENFQRLSEDSETSDDVRRQYGRCVLLKENGCL